MKQKITIITPTYNRSKEIKKLYESLKTQKSKDFIWLVIDDGSTDDTKKYIRNCQDEKIINIEYIYKDNGGKHTALNCAFKKIKTELFCIVDSDDYLTADAVETILNYYMEYKDKNIFGYVFLKGYSIDNPITAKFKKDIFVGDYVKDIINKQPLGDRFEVFYTELLKGHEFPIFENEKFIGEGFFWNIISKNKKLVFVNKILYICHYLDGGLTKQGRRMRIINSMGGLTHALEYIKKEYAFKIRVKNMILYHVYYNFAKKQGKNPTKINISFLKLLCSFPGYILYKYWNKKYFC